MELSFEQIAGIDFGNKLAGSTVIAFPVGQPARIEFVQSRKKADADRFICDWAEVHQPAVIFLDAPLSLPGVYTRLSGCDDFFYRQADRQLKAMSPMFLGGLTARAMRLKRHLEEKGVSIREVYPAALARTIDLAGLGYRQRQAAAPEIAGRIAGQLPGTVNPEEVSSWHHVDALLALLSGWRFLEGVHQRYGDQSEGMIIV